MKEELWLVHDHQTLRFNLSNNVYYHVNEQALTGTQVELLIPNKKDNARLKVNYTRKIVFKLEEFLIRLQSQLNILRPISTLDQKSLKRAGKLRLRIYLNRNPFKLQCGLEHIANSL